MLPSVCPKASTTGAAVPRDPGCSCHASRRAAASAARPLQKALTVRTLSSSLAGTVTEPRYTTGRIAPRVPLVEALAGDAAVSVHLRVRSRAASPFAGCAWHRSWPGPASAEELAARCCIGLRVADVVARAPRP